MSEDLRLKHPFTCILSGPCCSGKSSFCIKFLQNLESFSTKTKFGGGILWCYGEKKAVPTVDVGRIIQFHESVPENSTRARRKPCLIILDNLLDEVYSEELCRLFTKGSHRRNINVILITQNLFHQGRYCRDISLKAKYIVLLKNIRDKHQFTLLARQVYSEDSASQYGEYLDATKTLTVIWCNISHKIRTIK